ncbi:MAG: PD-(D/E)XK nuclease family protein [Porphyromonas sp.]|uniref:PD-(D/E)XK nuclease family protein n=1 Tax=Porphyromonas sp. TaxID=1924944 RepID=UPI002A75EFFD|nr:PD-(D/E)XK nuclease family protein [Porphyromonas sp.]MDY3112257.1 PD-(D/E)XK nuclease family protein [Porphyromonas sp.]
MDSRDNFLSQVVRRLRNSGTPLREQLVVVPTKRAGTFLQRELIAQLADAATILPRIVTIDEWITEMSGRVILDNTALISILYEVYAAYLAEQGEAQAETDQMLRLSQTERMLRDFQDMDLALAHVEMLLVNLEELDAFDDYEFLTEEERDAIQKFWTALPKDFFKKAHGAEYLHFSIVWREIYKRFNARLTELGVAYRAAAYRLVAERGFTDEDLLNELRRHSGSKISLVSFVGLYNLTPAEHKIINKLQTADADALKVQLYWQKVSLNATDEFTDHLYRMIEQNVRLLGGEVIDEGEVIDGEEARGYSPEIHLLSLNSTILQPQVVNSLIDEIIKRDPKALEELRIAIVLNDEKTLIPLMKSLKQPTCTSLNVTMGYPLQYTSVATWIRRYLNIFGIVNPSDRELARVKLTCSRLQLWLAAPLTRKLFGELTTPLMEQIALHHYAIKASELREIIEELTKDADEAIRQSLLEILTPSFTGRELLGRVGQLLELIKGTSAAPEEEEDEAAEEPIDQVILSEARDQIVRHATQVSNLLTVRGGVRHLLDTPMHVAYLLEQLLAVGSIPFEGAPLEGLQVMGFLETRTLTFDYVIMLNVQEGDLPKSSHTTTLIPDMLRRAFGMTTYRTEDDTNAYHFYRLIQGAKEVYLLQDTRPKSISSMEPSRYVDQIRYLTDLSLLEYSYADQLEARDGTEIDAPSAEKDEAVRHYLEQIAKGEKTFSPSDLITYYKCPYQFYLKKIKGVGEPRPEPGVVTQIELGSMVHEYLELFYKGLVQKHGDVITRDQLEHKVSRQMLTDIYKEIVSDKSVPDDILLTDLERYIYKALEIDRLLLGSTGSLQLLASEAKMQNVPFEWESAGQRHKIHLTGQPDRVDKVCGGVCRIVDYKTGEIKKAKKLTELNEETLDSWSKSGSNCSLGGYMLQSYLYALLYAKQSEYEISEVQPTLYSLAPAIPASQGAINFGKSTTLTAIETILIHYLNKLVNPKEKFTQTTLLSLCSYCNYRTICGRKKLDF